MSTPSRRKMREALAASTRHLESKDYDQAHAVCGQAAKHAADHIDEQQSTNRGTRALSKTHSARCTETGLDGVTSANQILPTEDTMPASSTAAAVNVINPMLTSASHNHLRRCDNELSNGNDSGNSTRDDESSNDTDDVNTLPSPGPGNRRRRTSVVLLLAAIDGGGVRLRTWCVGNSVASIVLLVLILITTSFYFACQATSLLDVMVDEPTVRRFVGVTVTVETAVWIMCLPATLSIFVVLVQITCHGRRTVRNAVASEKKLVEETTSESTARAVYTFYAYFSSPRSPYFFVIAFASECSEFFFQCLAVEQLSRSGVGVGGLVLYTSVILLNALVRRRAAGRCCVCV